MITYCFFIWILTQGCFVPSLVEIGSVVLEKKIFKFCQCIFAISLLSPLGKGQGPSFEQIWIPLTQGCFVPRLVEIDPVVQEKMNNVKSLQTDGQTEGQTDDGRQVIRKAHLSFQLRWAKINALNLYWYKTSWKIRKNSTKKRH